MPTKHHFSSTVQKWGELFCTHPTGGVTLQLSLCVQVGVPKTTKEIS
jgi:hypothetical protein